VEGYCHIAHFEELKENEFNLNVPRYVDISETEEEIDIQKTIDDLMKLEKEREEIEVQVSKNLQELGFKS
jgi:type I restriction enzyme M protein